MDPESGEFTTAKPGYSPCALVFFDFVWRLYGVRASSETLEWNCRLPPDSSACVSALRLRQGIAELQTTSSGSRLLIQGKHVAQVTGEARLITTIDGRPQRLVGTAHADVSVVLRRFGVERRYWLRSDQSLGVRRDFETS